MNGVDMRFEAWMSIPGERELNKLQGRKGGY